MSATQHAAYLRALSVFDWGGDFIDDGMRHRQWREKLAVLRDMQRECDPTGELWISMSPGSHGAPVPFNYTIEVA